MTLKIALILRVDLSACVNLVSLEFQGGAQVKNNTFVTPKWLNSFPLYTYCWKAMQEHNRGVNHRQPLILTVAHTTSYDIVGFTEPVRP